MNRFQVISCLISKEPSRSLCTVSKIMDFKENDLFQENEQNEQISVKSADLKK